MFPACRPAFRQWTSSLWLLLLPALLAGCFQQRGETFQPASSTALPPEPASGLDLTPPDSAGPTDDNASPGSLQVIVPMHNNAGQMLTTPTALPITVFMQPVRPPVETQPAGGQQPIETPLPGQFITPASPLGLVFETVAPPLQPAESSGLVTPTAFNAEISAESAPVSSSACTYTVRPGDNLYRIAVNHNTTLAAMRQANPDLTGQAPILQPGQVLRLPNCPADSSDTVALPSTSAPPTVPPVPGQQQVYRVQPGDTLYGIALRFGTTIAALQEVNRLPNPNRLNVGQEIIIPAP